MVADLKRAIFSDKAVNAGRQDELDLAKFIIIFFMPIIHCIIECTPEDALVSGIPYLFDTIIGGPFTAPMFMFAMGIGMVYTKSKAPDRYLRRGLLLFLIGIILNICRFLVPFLIGYLVTGDYDYFISPLLYLVLENDILLFAGLAMITLHFLIRLRLKDGVLLLVCVGLSLVATFLIGTDTGSIAGNIFLGYLIGTEDAAGLVHSYFPLLNWLIVPASGYIFGKRLLHVKNKPLFYRTISPVCLIITAIYFSVGIASGSGMFGEGENCYYHMTTRDAISSVFAAIGMLGVYSLIAPHLSQKIYAVVFDVSRNITAVYCIHWIFVTCVIDVIFYIARGTTELNAYATVLLGAVIAVISMIIAHFFSKNQRLRRVRA